MFCIHHTKMNGISSMAMLMSYGISDILKRCWTALWDTTALHILASVPSHSGQVQHHGQEGCFTFKKL